MHGHHGHHGSCHRGGGASLELAHQHHPGQGGRHGSDGRWIVLVGNPNTGKSVFFNALTGIYVDVSNFPGTTVDVSQGRWGNDTVLDTPGIYGVAAFNDEERVAREIIVQADVVVNIVDAVHLERDLFLTQQLIDMGLPLVVALNMMDEAEAQGLRIDVAMLEESLGVPVIPTVAVKQQGLDRLKSAIPEARRGHIDPTLSTKLRSWYGTEETTPAMLLAAEGDEEIAAAADLQPMHAREELYLHRRQRVNDLLARAVADTRDEGGFGETLSRLMIRPLTGVPILGGVLVLLPPRKRRSRAALHTKS
ncbi:MAG TPA: FeoB small GTPase domain-containing protein [Chloroflexota bacterium]|nr:FeoB small GTPase domain-containing protein [Chloroflexota bacterium]